MSKALTKAFEGELIKAMHQYKEMPPGDISADVRNRIDITFNKICKTLNIYEDAERKQIEPTRLVAHLLDEIEEELYFIKSHIKSFQRSCETE